MQKSAFLVALLDVLRARLPDPEHGLAAAFAQQFWARIPEEDLVERQPDDAAGATMAAFRLFARRQPDDVGVVACNPALERDGYASRHTVVIVAHRDMPFITDSMLVELAHAELVTHHLQNVVFDALRDEAGQLVSVEPGAPGSRAEALVFAEIDRLEDERVEELRARVATTLADVRAVVGDFGAMKARLDEIVHSVADAPPPLPAEEVEEGIAFLRWLPAGNFTFLGYRAFDFTDGVVRQVPGSALGVLRHRKPSSERAVASLSAAARAFLLEPRMLAFSKSGTRSRVHRPAYPDYVAVKRFDGEGRVVGEHDFLGMYTSRVYTERPEHIPVLRRKVANVKLRSGLRMDGFDGKVLTQVLASYPRDELFQSDEDELLANALAITYVHERRRTRVFLRRDRYGLFCSCLVFLPRELYNTELRVRIQRLLRDTLDATDVPFDVHFSESILVRLHFVARVSPGASAAVDIAGLERQIVLLARDWKQEVRAALTLARGEVEGRRLAARWVDAMPGAYREAFDPRVAVADIADMERLSPATPINMRFYRVPGEGETRVHLKVFHLGEPLPLSDVLPTLEHLGMRVLSEHPYALSPAHMPISMHDFVLDTGTALDLADLGPRFEDAFVHVWNEATDDDAFNRLVLCAGLTWREVSVLRAYAHYLKQIRFAFSEAFIADTLVAHPDIAAKLVEYFRTRFDPDGEDDGSVLRTTLVAMLDRVSLLNEDRILRRLLDLIGATLRTNFFRAHADGAALARLSFKLDAKAIPNLPAPVPQYEIFVFSPRVEGVHLRAGAIARGGLRWSDRHEDYRTEALGLVKAQIVKNAVIVPTGAKGAFVVRRPPADRDAYAAEGRACYEAFVGGLLDVTDDIVGGRVVPPPRVRRYDGDDPYLVVAADKGTATFSDVANAVAQAQGFWLGDAFASGGSRGYDHKRMGITARGAWISVERHFVERGVDANRDPITVVGIGDMSGDVFGNGLLRSRSVRLVAAFNHLHVFVDPDPAPVRSFEERARLFALPRSSWADYDPAALSAGGAVYARSQKSIRLSPEAQRRLGIATSVLTPDELIHAILCAPVDLVWNGGIGTYVKASDETHADVGDRANDVIRIDATALRARVFGEGGNLGMTQRARVEFALAGGGVNTDFVDNSAGVDCSDHEVNLKILFDHLVAEGSLTVERRNALLVSMTDAVAELVLTDNFRQAQALSIAERQVRYRASEYQRFVARLEADGRLDRTLEEIPTDEAFAARAAAGRWLTRPELAVLLAYAKIHLKEALLGGGVHSDPLIADRLFDEFPRPVREAFADAAKRHRLFAEIVATMVANDVVHHLGITSVVHLGEFVGGDVDEIVRAYFVAAACFGIREQFRAIEARTDVDAQARIELLLEQVQLARRATRWLLRHRRGRLDVASLVAELKPRVEALLPHAPGHDQTPSRRAWGLPVTLALIDAANSVGCDDVALAAVFGELNSTLGFDWLGDQLMALPAASLWQAMERDALVDELVTQHAQLAAFALSNGCEGPPSEAVARFLAREAKAIGGWKRALENARRSGGQDFALYSMTLRKLGDVTRALGAGR